ncbi:MAG: flagellar type III secretion system pore protein FliP [Oscillospiraceae bacterium]
MLKRLFETDKKLMMKFAVSLSITIVLAIVLCVALSSVGSYSQASAAVATTTTTENNTGAGDGAAAGTETENSGGGAQPGDYVDNPGITTGDDVGSSVLQELIGVDASQPLEVIVLLTIIALIPSLLIMMTSFTRIVIVMGFLRNALQSQSTPPNMVITGLSLILTVFIMAPVFVEINEEAYQPYVNEEITMEEALEKSVVPLKRFMLKQVTNNDLQFFVDLSKTEIPEGGMTDEYKQTQLPITVIIPTFVVSELKRAFQMGFLIYLPFLVIDIVVGSTLMSMGMMMLPPAMISMPFKILVFVLADGWNLLIDAIVASYNL